MMSKEDSRYFGIPKRGPWKNRKNIQVRKHATSKRFCVPVSHFADVIGKSESQVGFAATKAGIELVGSMPGVATPYAKWVAVDDFPKLLRYFDWSERDVKRGMQQLGRFVYGSEYVYGDDAAAEQNEDEEDNNDDDEEYHREESPRNADSVASPLSNADFCAFATRVNETLAALRATHEKEAAATRAFLAAHAKEVKDLSGSYMALLREKAVPAYFGTEEWKAEKPRLKQAYVDRNGPEWERAERKRMRDEWQAEETKFREDRKKKIEEEIRGNAQEDMRKSVATVQMIASVLPPPLANGKKHKKDSDEATLPSPLMTEQNGGDDDDALFMANYMERKGWNNHTE